MVRKKSETRAGCSDDQWLQRDRFNTDADLQLERLIRAEIDRTGRVACKADMTNANGIATGFRRGELKPTGAVRYR